MQVTPISYSCPHVTQESCATKTSECKKIASGAEESRNKGRRKETIRKEGKKKVENYKQRGREGAAAPNQLKWHPGNPVAELFPTVKEGPWTRLASKSLLSVAVARGRAGVDGETPRDSDVKSTDGVPLISLICSTQFHRQLPRTNYLTKSVQAIFQLCCMISRYAVANILNTELCFIDHYYPFISIRSQWWIT